jgi:hypothetical protein
MKGCFVTALQLALDYARRGYFVFPCLAGLKAPATEHGWREATTNESQIERWWAENPKYNVAIATGPSGLLVVDVDPEGIEAWETMLADDPALMQVASLTHLIETPRGGFHVYFRGEGRSTVGKLAAGIDTRGAGGYVLAPPSRVNTAKSAGEYSVLSEAEPLPVPAALAALLARAEPVRDAPALPPEDAAWDSPEALLRARVWLEGLSARGPVAFEGQRNDALYKVACGVLQFGIKPATAFGLICDLWNPHCAPPLGEEEIENTIRSAWRNGEQTRGGKAEQPLAEQHAHLLAAAPAEPAKSAVEEDEYAYLDPTPIGLAYANAKPLEWLLENYMPKQGVGYLYGPSGTYKTFLALDLALSVATGYGPNWWEGANRKPMPVVYMCGESVEAFKTVRYRAWLAANPLPGIESLSNNLMIVEDVPPYEMTEHWARFEANVVKRVKKAGFDRPALLIVDTLTQAMVGISMNDQKEASKVARHFRKMAKRLDCFVLIINHTGKDEKAGMIGSFLWFATADTVVSVQRESAAGETALLLTTEKQKESAPGLPKRFVGEGEGASTVFKRDWNAKFDTSGEEPKVIAGAGTEEWLKPEALHHELKNGPMTTEHLAESLAERWTVDKKRVQRRLKRVAQTRYRAWMLTDDVWSIPAAEPKPIDTSIF